MLKKPKIKEKQDQQPKPNAYDYAYRPKYTLLHESCTKKLNNIKIKQHQ